VWRNRRQKRLNRPPCDLLKGCQVLRKKNRMCRFVTAFTRIALCPFYRIEIRGQERLPRKDAFILLPKHQCWQDIPLIALATPRPLYYIAKYELFANRLAGWFLESLGGIPLNREQPMKSRRSIRAMMSLLKGGEGIVIFPEGTYYVNKMGPGRSGMLRLIISRMSFPMIPTGIHYQKGHSRTGVRISFGAPIYPGKSVPTDAVLSMVMREIAILSGLDDVCCIEPKACSDPWN
jgi:1-acyl-sn-glycerol-3-phosphate acyltransferase